MKPLRLIGAVSLLLCMTLSAIAAEDYRIEPLENDLYRFTAGNYRSVFLVTKAGIVLTDPIDKKAATWLKRELQKRFEVPVRYVIYSHNHVDHTYGGRVFADESVHFVSHRLAREDLYRTRADTQIPDITFEDRMTLHLGDHQVKLHYHGANNGRGSISMMFEPGKTLYIVDWIVLGRMPYKDLKGYDIHGMIDSTRQVLAMDFDRVVGGHAEAGDRQAVEHYLGYLEALYAAVRDGMLKNKSLATLQQEIRLDQYSDLSMYEQWLPLNIKGVYNTLNDMSYFDMRNDLEG